MRCPTYRQSQLDIGWTEDYCARLDEIAAEDHSYVATAAERARRENTWVVVLHSSGPNGSVNQREDYVEGQENLSTTISRIWSKSPQTSTSRTSSIATRPTICLERRRSGARRPEDRLEVVRKHQFLLPQDGNHLRGNNAKNFGTSSERHFSQCSAAHSVIRKEMHHLKKFM